MRVIILNMFLHLFMCRLRVWDRVLFSASVRNAASHAVWGPDGLIPTFIFLPETHTRFAKAKKYMNYSPEHSDFIFVKDENIPSSKSPK